MSYRSAATIADHEVEQFSAIAADWWNPEGALRPLHRLNPVRLGYILDQIGTKFGRDKTKRQVLSGLQWLDVGCGGGLLTEPLARLGAKVTGLDAAAAAINVAKKHAEKSGLTINYKTASVEALAKQKQRYDVITAMEVVEHVADVDLFLASLSQLLKPQGVLIMSTLNRTPKSFALGIVAAEYILNIVPRGTHQWRQFIRPSEMVQKLEANGLKITNLTGLIFNPLRNEFALSPHDLEINYLLTAQR